MKLKIYPVIMSPAKHEEFKMSCYNAKMTMKEAFELLIDEFIREQKLDQEKNDLEGGFDGNKNN